MKDQPDLSAFFERLNERIENKIPPKLFQFKEEITALVNGLLRESITKMNLVSREEFDVQTALLQKVEQQLQQLEEKINAQSQNKPE